MKGRINYGKLTAAAFLTVLIWVWADRALEAELPVYNAIVSIARTTGPNCWISFDGEPSALIEQMVFEGPSSKISRLKRDLAEGNRHLEFFIDPTKNAVAAPGEHTLNLLDFLKKNDEIGQLGLTVKTCLPETLSIDVVSLVKMSLEIKCMDDQRNIIKDAIVEPTKVEMMVPENWRGEKLTANVVLGRREIEQARISPIEKKPFIELSAGQPREAAATVKVSTPQVAELLRDYTITTTTLGFNLSANLQGKISVEVINPDDVMGAITIKATAEAKRAYENMRYQVILEVEDSDRDIRNDGPIRKELVYNFPSDYVRRDEIVLNQQPVIARFRIKPLSPPTENSFNPTD